MQPIHIFRVGKHTASDGTVIDFSADDLQRTAAAYNPATHEAPIVVGHPATDDPAFGWVQGLSFADGNLFAQPHQVHPQFAEQVQQGLYRKVSASFYPPDHPSNPTPGVYALRHVGFLGAEPPALKGLKPVAFAESAKVLCFADAANALPIEQDGTNTPPTTPPNTPPNTSPITKEPPAMTNEEAQAIQARAAQLEADLAAAQAALLKQVQATNTAAHAAFAEQLVQQGRLAQADAAFVVATLDHFEPATLPGTQAPTVLSFGEGAAKVSMADALRKLLQTIPPRVEFAEQASRQRAAAAGGDEGTVTYAEGTPPESIELDKRIRAYAAAHKVSYAQAAAAVAR